MDISESLPLQNGSPAVGNPCVPQAGYDDIAAGAQVVISDTDGETLAVGELRDGYLQDGPGGSAFFQSVCEYPFIVSRIPQGEKFYAVHIGNTNRGERNYTQAQLEAGEIALSIGG
ncbi:hypothetical protein [Curtobacterium sp. VKM Ac-1376]|uniref:hypothetical protein n=1 Tax=Curtobacterium sp. VKM Ac-1376 TaxID=123312 RepID=UPI00188A9D47|nr:hypothetical protein [Curtobacterium sp. VKM Ac-1376]MBF4613731.1 hypothetical protein [Curtobacterium sp. VKM Ac-1376]